MKIKLKRLNQAVHFECANEHGNLVHTDGSPAIGGEGKGARPMELLLMSLASCSSIDVVEILKKMRQPLEDLQVEVTGERAMDEVPAIFKKIHLHFQLAGQLKPEKVEEAIRLSVGKYCSVARMLEKTADITWNFSIGTQS